MNRKSCLVALALIVGVPVVGLGGALGWSAWEEHKALDAHRQQSEQLFAPALQALSPEEAAVDLDKTVRLMHALDLALVESDSLPGFLKEVARHDWRGVDPDVLEARRELTGVLLEIYATQLEVEDQHAMWDVTSSTLALVSVVGGDIGLATSPLSPMGFDGKVELDQERARDLYDQLRDDKEQTRRLQERLGELEGQLLETLFSYSDVYYGVLQKWDRVCVERDRAWLAAWDGQWDEAIEAADAAIALAPQEREAHLIKAWALVELGRTEQADALIANQIDAHPGHSAPLLLLRGASAFKQGDRNEARLSYQQAASSYPKQAEFLTDMADPYAMRTHLRKSREGGYILELYRSTMLGAGYFSPDLHLARLHFEAGDPEAGRAKVMDHFSRRRAQGQWDFVLQDIELCIALLGDDYRLIFPEDAYLDLTVDEALMGSSLGLNVHNRSDRTLRNATLVLAVQLTDMHPDDYMTFVGGETQPAVPAYEHVDFGDVEVAVEMLGEVKKTTDVVLVRAILVSNEAVIWVDTDEYKLAETHRDDKRDFGGAVTRAVSLTGERTEVTVERGMFSDEVTFLLPRELALLHPTFSLDIGGELHGPDENRIGEDGIEVIFSGVQVSGDALELRVSSPYQDLRLSFGTRGEDWGLVTLRRE